MHQRQPKSGQTLKYTLCDDRQITTSDTYQLFAYALALTSGSTDATVGLIYPGRQTKITNRLDIAPHAAPTRARITVASIDVATIVDQISTTGVIPEMVSCPYDNLHDLLLGPSNPHEPPQPTLSDAQNSETPPLRGRQVPCAHAFRSYHG